MVNPLTADAKYFLHKMRNLPQLKKCIYLKNQKGFVDMLLHFQNLCKVLNNFFKKLEPHSSIIFEIIHSEKRGFLNA